MFPLFALALNFFVMALAAAYAWCEHHQKLLGVQLHPEDVDAVLESVTVHAEKGSGTKTTLYVGQQEAEEVEEEVKELVEVGARREKDKLRTPS